MFKTLIRLLPQSQQRIFTRYLVLVTSGVLLRALSTVLLVPLVGALFGSTPSDAWPWLGALTASTLLGWLIDAIANRTAYSLGFSLLDHAQHSVADQLTHTKLDWFHPENRRTAREAIAATGPELVGLFGYLLTPLIGSALLPLAIGLALLPISLPLALTALAGVPILLLAFWGSIRISGRADRLAADSNSLLSERVLEFARTQQALRAARRVENARSLSGEALHAQHGATVRLLAMQIPGQLIFSLASQIALFGLAAVTAVLAVTGAVSVPQAIALIVVIARYLEPFSTLGELSAAIESTTTTLGRLKTVLDSAVVPVGKETLPMHLDAPRIEFKKVTFEYQSGQPILRDFSLTLEPGSTTAIVGPSGSGKSTVLALLAGLHAPRSGQILVNGVDIARYDAESRRRLVSMVFQLPYLFDGSIRDNIMAGHPESLPGQLATVTRLARVDELTDRFPAGIESAVGEAGSALSGGERQRVSIARALLKPAPILLVDEATSALDNLNEQAVAQALTDQSQDRTRIVVAHRLSSIRTAQRVLFLENGTIVEDGSIEQLRAQNGRFAAFWRQQHQAAEWQLSSQTDGRTADVG